MNAAVVDPTTTVDLPRFGEFTYAESEVFEFPWGIPGFSKLHRFVAIQLDEQPNFIWLQSLDDVNVALPAASPWSIFSEYDPQLPAYATTALELRSPEDFAVLCVVVVTNNAQEMTMNLLAPIVINLKTRRGRQITLESGDYSVRTKIPRTFDANEGTEAVEGAATQ